MLTDPPSRNLDPPSWDPEPNNNLWLLRSGCSPAAKLVDERRESLGRVCRIVRGALSVRLGLEVVARMGENQPWRRRAGRAALRRGGLGWSSSFLGRCMIRHFRGRYKGTAEGRCPGKLLACGCPVASLIGSCGFRMYGLGYWRSHSQEAAG